MAPDRVDVLERRIGWALAATVFWFAAGSSVVDLFELLGRPLRWVALLALLALALAYVRAQSASLADAAVRLATPAAALAALLAALAATSALWSAGPRLTLGRAASFAVLLLAAAALAAGAAARPRALPRFLAALVAGGAVVAAAGVAVLVFSYDSAVQEASTAYPARYRGFGQNPNTVPALLGVVAPAAVWLALEARSARLRLGAAAAAALFWASIVGSGSRGALVAGAAGVAVVAAARATLRRRGLLLGGAAVAVAAGALLMQLPDARSGSLTRPPAKPNDAEAVFPLDAELGRGRPGEPAPPVRRRLFGGSGRADAWEGALRQVAERPVAGYGFGNEGEVFVDRYYFFSSNVPENSYLGVLLQVGIAGLAVLAALLAAIGSAALRAIRAPDCAAALGVFAAGLVLGMSQSYLVAAGNIATGSVWICGFLAAYAARRRASATSGSAASAR